MTEMSPAEAVFFAALERPTPAERDAYLDGACAGDPALRARVEKLLAAHPRVGGFLEPAVAGDAIGAFGGADGGDAPPTADFPGAGGRATAEPTADYPGRDERVGAVLGGKYKLIEEIGAGGMGSVYMAQQTEPVKRAVAVKVIKAGMDSKAVLARFEAERQALAMMEHPNIARVLDAGTTESGRPFFVMELVKGTPITEFCDERKLPPRQRLELFVPVCNAIQHAHQKGVIHRDIKPSNVLIALYDDRAVPKVIDFGVAKAAGQPLTDKTLMTGFGAVVGTPEYMSPEQANLNNLDIDTRSDVYSLGVLLYELLTGTTPVDRKSLGQAALLEVLRIVREVEAPRASAKLSTIDTLPSVAANRGTEPANLSRLMKGELDWVLLKALEKERTRRYETANALARDIQRYLADEEVEARPPSAGYRLKKFVRRHKGRVAAAGLVLFALAAGMAGTTWGLFEAKKQERIARDETVEKENARSAEAERVKERDAALTQEAERVKERDYQLGIGDFLLAVAAYDKRDVGRAAERLDKVPPGQRGWEWRYLKQQTRGGLFTLFGHTGGVRSVGFSADGARIVTGSDDETAKVWDARTGAPLLDLKGHTRGVTSVSFSPDGARIVTGSQDRMAKVWDARTGTPLLDLKGHTGQVASVSYSPDGMRIVTGGGAWGGSGEAKVWDARTGEPLLELKGHPSFVGSVSFSADGTRVVTGSQDRTAKVWDARTGALQLDLTGHTDAVRNVSFGPDGTRIVTASWGDWARVSDARTGALLLELKGRPGYVGSVSYSPDGTRIVTGDVGPDGTANVWDARTGNQLLELKGHTGGVGSVSYSPDGTRIVTGSGDGTARVWDARTETPLLDLTKAHTGRLLDVSYSPDGTRIATCGDGASDGPGEAKVWDARTGEPLLELKGHTSFVGSVSFSADGTRVVTGSQDKTAKVWDARTGALQLDLTGLAAAVSSVSFSPDGSCIVTGGRQGRVGDAKVWDARTGRALVDLTGHKFRVMGVSFSPDGSRLATASFDGMVKIWDTRAWTPLLDLHSSGGLWRMSFSPDGSRIVTGSNLGLVQVWDASSGRVLLELRTSRLHRVSFSPDGRRIITGTMDGSVKVWDARTGTPLLELNPGPGMWSVSFSPDGSRLATGGGHSADGTSRFRIWNAWIGTAVLHLKGHTDRVSGLSFSPDGTRVATGSWDKTAKVWDARTGTLLLDLKGHTDGVASVAFSPDGSRIVTGSWDKTAKVWDAYAGNPLLELKHTDGVASVAFSPDGTRIVAGGGDSSDTPGSLKVWDARTGTALLDLQGHWAGWVSSVSFSPDGMRIVTNRDTEKAQVWDARTGEEAKGEPMPPAPRSGKISQDGRWIAFAVDNRIELVPLQLDSEEIEYRRSHSRPNARYYSEGYVAARKSDDSFAARFYLDRLIDFYTATNKPDEVKKWQAERAKYPEAAPPPRQKK